ncbi:MAG: PEP-CTERM sorting domain-containing protein [Planctomycetes bacterium]|nr:PEP-CTERM sorting domain-containing protein [Planctomycetota bacterium]
MRTRALRAGEQVVLGWAMAVVLAGASPAARAVVFLPDGADGPAMGNVLNNPTGGGLYSLPLVIPILLDGLPPGTQVVGSINARNFILQSSTPGGPLGGMVENFSSNLPMHLTGTGSLAGWQRDITIPNVLSQVQSGPRVPGTSLQSFPTDMFLLQGQLPPGDPDFDLLRITGGSGFGMPSPGQTTLTQQPKGNWAVDSFFDIEYRIDFIGAPGGVLAGRSGSTTCTERFRPGELVIPGTDLYRTESGEFRFGETNPIPPGFFGPGSDPFTGNIPLRGAPLETLPPGTLGDADTLVQRLGPVPLPHEGSDGQVPIELVALSLMSTQPILVTNSATGDSFWDVSVSLSPPPQPQGSMTVTRGAANGGTFSATLPVLPRFTFTEVGNPGNQQILDYGDLYPPITLDPTVPWDYFALPSDGPMPQASQDNQFFAQSGIFYTSREFDLSLRNATAGAAAAIPEPTTVALVALGLLAVFRRRRRH